MLIHAQLADFGRRLFKAPLEALSAPEAASPQESRSGNGRQAGNRTAPDSLDIGYSCIAQKMSLKLGTWPGFDRMFLDAWLCLAYCTSFYGSLGVGVLRLKPTSSWRITDFLGLKTWKMSQDFIKTFFKWHKVKSWDIFGSHFFVTLERSWKLQGPFRIAEPSK